MGFQENSLKSDIVPKVSEWVENDSPSTLYSGSPLDSTRDITNLNDNNTAGSTNSTNKEDAEKFGVSLDPSGSGISGDTIVFSKTDIESQTIKHKSSSSFISSSSTTCDDNDDNEDKPRVQLPLPKFLIICFGLFLAMLLAAMDQTIVAAILPTIGKDFNSLSSATGWVATSYLVTMTSFQPLYGKLSDIFGRLQILTFALTIFLIGSALCGSAQTMVWLIIARAVTGIGGGGIISIVMVIISDITTIKERGRYMGYFSTAWAVASVLGPILGGVFTEKISMGGWRWCFYINLPVGAITIITTLIFLRVPQSNTTTTTGGGGGGGGGGGWKSKLKRVDFLGSFVVVSGLVLLLLALSWGGKEYTWNSPLIIALFVVGVLLLIGFALIEIYVAPEPIITPSLFKIRSVVAIFVASMMAGMVMYSMIFYLPLYFAVTHNMTAIESGVRLLPFHVPVTTFAIMAGIFMSRFGYYRLVGGVGFVLATIGNGILTLLAPDSNLGQQIGYPILSGIGIGLVLNPTFVIAQASVKPDMVAVVTSLIVFTRTIGGVFGIAISNAVFTNSLKSNLKQVAKEFPEYMKTILEAQDDSSLIWNPDVGLPLDVRDLAIDAYGKALHWFFVLMVPLAGLGLISILCVGRVVSKRPARSSSGSNGSNGSQKDRNEKIMIVTE
ncbi:hypothetical protein H4219_004554 [Mycoemilia scoparia]|uniref:Major facilitator superfamily (MFS) profile domain-containing protein n=1 Tax=Mycoemilia scoparia TaxID=417184 RepID=A0A9W8DR58_9FUNG|nr:hypothetical protein H4219_004554 [Mycoemilia scoparia]